MTIQPPFLLYIGDAGRTDAKTALGVLYWRTEDCLAQWRAPQGHDAGLPQASPEEAVALGARTLIVGVADFGGRLKPAWIPDLVRALYAGLDIASGLHQRLVDCPELAYAAALNGRQLIDVRHPRADQLKIGTGEKRTGRRVLTVGTDCAVGKMFTSLALTKELRLRGLSADFRATGQTGVFIAGAGVSVDAVVADFVAGAAELLSPAAAPDHWDSIEGQGSLHHPAYAGVTTSLIHGSQPDALVLCHDPSRTHLDGYPDYPAPALAEAIALNTAVARLTNPAAHVVGVSLNTSRVEAPFALLEAAAKETGLPCVDPVRTGVGALVDQLLKAPV